MPTPSESASETPRRRSPGHPDIVQDVHDEHLGIPPSYCSAICARHDTGCSYCGGCHPDHVEHVCLALDVPHRFL